MLGDVKREIFLKYKRALFAIRFRTMRGDRRNDVGFRVVCVAPSTI